MTWSRPLLAGALLISALLLACGDDDSEDNASATPTRSPARSRTATPSMATAPAPSPTDSAEKTPLPEETDQPPIDTGTPPPPAEQGRQAVEPADTAAFLAQFQGRTVVDENCAYNPSTRVTSCGERGLYAVNPPLSGQDITCMIGIVDGNPEYIRCTSAEPVHTKYYDIQ